MSPRRTWSKLLSDSAANGEVEKTLRQAHITNTFQFQHAVPKRRPRYASFTIRLPYLPILRRSYLLLRLPQYPEQCCWWNSRCDSRCWIGSNCGFTSLFVMWPCRNVRGKDGGWRGGWEQAIRDEGEAEDLSYCWNQDLINFCWRALLLASKVQQDLSEVQDRGCGVLSVSTEICGDGNGEQTQSYCLWKLLTSALETFLCLLRMWSHFFLIPWIWFLHGV